MTDDTAIANLEYVEISSIDELEVVEIKSVSDSVESVASVEKSDDESDLSAVAREVSRDAEEDQNAISDITTAVRKASASQARKNLIPSINGKAIDKDIPMIPSIAPAAARGVGRNSAIATPFVLPATEEGRAKMAKNSVVDSAPAEQESISSFENAVRNAENLPIAPIIPINHQKASPVETAQQPVEQAVQYEAPTEQPQQIPVAEEPKENVVVVNMDVEIKFGESDDSDLINILSETSDDTTEKSDEEFIHADAKRADELITDEEAEAMIEIIDTPKGAGTGKLCEINLDTICENFNDGDTVSISSLKAKKLAPKNCGRVKILARGTMTKRLEIVADKYSLQAVKMITLAGGKAEQLK